MLSRCGDDDHLYCQDCQTHACQHVLTALAEGVAPASLPKTHFSTWRIVARVEQRFPAPVLLVRTAILAPHLPGLPGSPGVVMLYIVLSLT